MVLEAGSKREILISWFLELIIQVTVLWRGKRREKNTLLWLLLLASNILALWLLYLQTHLVLHQPLIQSELLLCWAPGRQGRSWRQTCWMSHSVQSQLSSSFHRPFVLQLPCHGSWACGHQMLLAPTKQWIIIYSKHLVNLKNIGSQKMTSINTESISGVPSSLTPPLISGQTHLFLHLQWYFTMPTVHDSENSGT